MASTTTAAASTPTTTTEAQLESESLQLSRSELQSYLKSHKLKATGTTVALRQAYLQARRAECGLSISTTAATAAAASTPTNKAPPHPCGTQAKRPANDDEKDDEKAPPAEKRLKRYRTTCSAATRQRIARARTQRLYLVEAPPLDDKDLKFVVLGSTGNLYTVTIANLVDCTCPDHQKTGNVCKHILFVLLKVVGLPAESPLLYQAALVSSELEEITTLFQARIATVGRTCTVMANDRVQQAYKELTSPDSKKKKSTEEDDTNNSRRQAIEGDCPICFDDLADDTQPLVWCQAMCGANFHKACMDHWKRNQRTAGSITCPNCRTPWQDDEESAKKKSEGYANLGRLQGQAALRDTSSYSDWYHRRNGGGWY